MTLIIFGAGLFIGLVILLVIYSWFSSSNVLGAGDTPVVIQSLIFILLSGIAALLIFKF